MGFQLTNVTLIFTLFLLAAGLSGGMLPLYTKLKERGLHCLLALGTGMLLGTIFLHMLPEALSRHGSPLLVLVGLLVVFILERLVFTAPNGNGLSHEVIGLTAFTGLSVHAIIVGLGLATQLADPIGRTTLMTSLLIHKLSETFALSTVFLLAGYSRKKAINLIVAFSFFTPTALVFGHFLLRNLPEHLMGAAAGLAAGTFLYVALLDLLPEVFHHPERKWMTFGALVLGISIIAAIVGVGGHAH